MKNAKPIRELARLEAWNAQLRVLYHAARGRSRRQFVRSAPVGDFLSRRARLRRHITALDARPAPRDLENDWIELHHAWDRVVDRFGETPRS
jgi:hypothetical protein